MSHGSRCWQLSERQISELVEAIKQTGKFCTERAAREALARKTGWGDKVVCGAIRAIGAVFVTARDGKLSIQLPDELRTKRYQKAA